MYIASLTRRSVNCYSTCIIGDPVPLQCCADSVPAPETISLTIEPEFLIARLYSPNSPNAYPSNRFCKYGCDCSMIINMQMLSSFYHNDIMHLCSGTTFNVQIQITIFITIWCDLTLSHGRRRQADVWTSYVCLIIANCSLVSRSPFFLLLPIKERPGDETKHIVAS